jgi:hypothetical protein
MGQALYRPIYYTWIVLYVTLVVGILVWILGRLVDLPWIWSEHYREYPSGLLLVFIFAFVAAASVFVGVFTGRKYLAAIVAAVAVAIGVIALYVIGWIMDIWDTATMLVVVLMLALVVIGVVFVFFARLKVVVLAWFVFSVVVCIVVIRWLESTWGTSFLFWLVLVMAALLYVVVALAFIMIPKSFVEA